MTDKERQTRWHEDAIKLFKQGHSKGEIYNILVVTYPEVTYFKIRGYVERYIMKNGTNASGVRTAEDDDIPTVEEVTSKPISVERQKDGTTILDRCIALEKGAPITDEAIMKAHFLDVEKWEIISYRSNVWQSQVKGGDRLDLYQSKLTVRPRKDPLPSFADIKKQFDTFKPNVAVGKGFSSLGPKGDTMFEVNIADLHLGKLAWVRESGESYDYKIATSRFNDIIDQEIARMKPYKVEKILFVWSNDFFNSDGINETTTGGTPQNDDLRWQKMYFVGCGLLISAIKRLSKVAPVETFLIASNHSKQVEFYAINHLYAWFRNDKRVKVDLNCQTRFYYRYGANLIGFSHSSYEKKSNLYGLMQVEAKKDWGETSYHEFHLAHFHCELVEEKNGIIFRWLPSVTGPDAWHESSGFVGAVQRSYSFIWNKNVGLVGINVDYPRDYLESTSGKNVKSTVSKKRRA
jgi:hypothetical protein